MKKSPKSSIILVMLGLVLFFLVLSVLYIMISISNIIPLEFIQAFMPFVVLCGFFIFLIGAMLIAFAIFKSLSGFK